MYMTYDRGRYEYVTYLLEEMYMCDLSARGKI